MPLVPAEDPPVLVSHHTTFPIDELPSLSTSLTPLSPAKAWSEEGGMNSGLQEHSTAAVRNAG